MSDYIWWFYDPDKGIRFGLNPSTGFVSSDDRAPGVFFNDSSCSGAGIDTVGTLDGNCAAAPAPSSHRVYGVGGDVNGLVEATAIYEEPTFNLGAQMTPPYRLVTDEGGMTTCVPSTTTICGLAVAYSSIIPTSFPLPIDVVTSLVQP